LFASEIGEDDRTTQKLNLRAKVQSQYHMIMWAVCRQGRFHLPCEPTRTNSWHQPQNQHQLLGGGAKCSAPRPLRCHAAAYVEGRTRPSKGCVCCGAHERPGSCARVLLAEGTHPPLQRLCVLRCARAPRQLRPGVAR
jgi:hypothetical protein